MFKWLRRLRALPPIPEAAWQAALRRYAFLGALPEPDRQRLRTLTAEFLRDKEFHGAKGFTITNEVALAIAAQAVLPVLHLKGGLNWYDDFVGIVVHRSEVVARRKVIDDAQVVHEYGEVVAGEAMDRGPVMLSWDDVLASSVTSERGYNVVIHEFAHKIDMRERRRQRLPAAAARLRGEPQHARGPLGVARRAETRLRRLSREDHPRGTLRRRAAVARRLRRHVPQRVLRGGLRGLFRQPTDLRPRLSRRARDLR
jgi:Mlc titration factor MtfA (ptsG expression regulator)